MVRVLFPTFQTASKKGSREFSRSDVIFQPPGESHIDRFHDKETRLFSNSFTAEWLDHIKEQAAILNTSVISIKYYALAFRTLEVVYCLNSVFNMSLDLTG